MHRPPTQFPPAPSGDSKETQWFKQLLKNIMERTVKVGVGLRASYTNEHTLIELAGPTSTGGVSQVQAGIKRLRIESVGPRSLTTFAYNDDGTNSGENGPEVAIPRYLRESRYENTQVGDYVFTVTNGEIRMRFLSHTNQSAYVVQQIFPPYAIGDDIYAIQPQGKTDIETETGELLEWMDANVDGRQLRSKFVLVDVCRLEGGQSVTRQIPVEGGNVF